MRLRARRAMFEKQYAAVFEGDATWNSIAVPHGRTLPVGRTSTYIKKPPYFDHMVDPATSVTDLHGLRVLAMLGDSVTTDHISPAGSIPTDSPAGRYLIAHGVAAPRFQFLRLAARQSRGDGARHAGQHSPAQSTGARHRRRLDRASSGRRTDVHLRRRHALSGRRRGVGDSGRQGVRLRLVARLGRQGRPPAGRRRGHRRELRAHTPLEPGRHGRPAASISRRRESPDAGAYRRGNLPRVRRGGSGGRLTASDGARGGCPAAARKSSRWWYAWILRWKPNTSAMVGFCRSS